MFPFVRVEQTCGHVDGKTDAVFSLCLSSSVLLQRNENSESCFTVSTVSWQRLILSSQISGDTIISHTL